MKPQERNDNTEQRRVRAEFEISFGCFWNNKKYAFPLGILPSEQQWLEDQSVAGEVSE